MKTFESYDFVSLLIDKIVEHGRERNLEIDAELVNPPDTELIIDKLIELKKPSTVEKNIYERF